MTEIRPIKRAECETFLHLLCDTFDLDYGRAEQVFYTEPMFELERKWALFEGPEMLSILNTVPVEFGWGRGIGIAGVATRQDRRGEGLSGRLIERVLDRSKKEGEGCALLFARDERLYARLGFRVLDEIVRGKIVQGPVADLGDIVSFEAVKSLYTEWAERHPARIRRDARRWAYWRWNLRVCTSVSGGYACLEGEMLREAVVPGHLDTGELALATEWLGLTNVANLLGLELKDPIRDLKLMGWNVPEPPQMFVTDQF